MIKNDEFEIEITDLGSEGEGIGRVDGMPFFIKGAVPGDRILAGVTKMKKTYGYARIVKFLDPSPDRITPECPIAGRCGGCQLQHMTYEAQLKYKQNKVLNDLIRIGGIGKDRFVFSPAKEGAAFADDVSGDGRILFYPVIGMEEPRHYRNKGQFPVGTAKDGSIVSGFYAGHTHSIIDTKSCLLQHELTDSLMRAVREYMSEAGVDAYDELRHSGLVRHVLTRVGFTTHEVMVCVVINGDKLQKAELLTAKLQRAVEEYNGTLSAADTAYRLASLSININRKDTNVILGDECRVLYGNMYITDCIGDIKYRISPLSFYQVNPVQTRRLYSTALEFAGLTGKEVVWDMYCGIGTLSVFMSYALNMLEPIQNIVNAISGVVAIRVNVERYMGLMNTTGEVFDSEEVIEKYGDAFNEKRENWESLTGDIEFENVTFKYPDGDETVLENFNLKVPRGTMTAIVGETGAGKSTLVNLVCRFFEPTKGRVLLDGRDIKERSLSWLHSNLGYVLQTAHLFSGSIRENLKYGNPQATDEEILKVLENVAPGFAEKKLKKGLDTAVEEGGDNFSAGEKQLLSIARALLADPRILILDEATAAIDSVTEKTIQEAIKTAIKGRTSFVIAHRLSTIVNADLIILVNEGRIVESGSHTELMRIKGEYYKLYTRQYEAISVDM